MSAAQLDRALAEVLAELKRATEKFPTWPTDPLHAVAVIGEEAGELTKAVLEAVYEPHKSTLGDVRAEALQTAAMVLRFLISIDAYDFRPGWQHGQDSVDQLHGASGASPMSREDEAREANTRG